MKVKELYNKYDDMKRELVFLLGKTFYDIEKGEIDKEREWEFYKKVKELNELGNKEIDID